MRLFIIMLLVTTSLVFSKNKTASLPLDTIPVNQATERLKALLKTIDTKSVSELLLYVDTLENDSIRAEALELFRRHRSPDLIAALEAYKSGTLYLYNEHLFIFSQAKNESGSVMFIVNDAISDTRFKSHNGSDSIVQNVLGKNLKAARNDRLLLSEIITSLSFTSSNAALQKESYIKAADNGAIEFLTDLIADSQFCSKRNRSYYTESVARLQLLHGNEVEKFTSITMLGKTGSTRAIASLEKIITDSSSATNPALITAATKAIKSALLYQRKINFIKSSFSGLSLGSILILLALGLSVIFGLMGVINMAHGEFMMLGAFTTYVVCEFFKNHVNPIYFDFYYIVAIPVSFIVCAIVGWICEALLIRKLYGRPFETILATWGLSLILIQIVRILFGDTLSLTPPSWLSGGWEIIPDLILPSNRIFIIFYCCVSILAFYLLVNKTRLGLLLRASTQDRQTASSLGVSVRKIDGAAFAIGTGLAGLAGAAVPLFDKINPGMGQGYIVDSFMVVVLGGVGNLAGSVIGGLGLGFLSKYIEPFIGAVYGKVIVLVLIVLFLQWKPSGLFPSRGRNADE